MSEQGILNRTLRLVLGTWEGDRQSLTSGMLKGIARVAYVYGETLNDERFKENVGRNSAKTISRTAKNRRAGTLGYAEALVMAYNAKSKYRLPIKLYTGMDGRKMKNQKNTKSMKKKHENTRFQLSRFYTTGIMTNRSSL